MNLNLGCGFWPVAGWTNVDLNPETSRYVDIWASVTDLPFPDGSADRIYCGHLLEHLGYDSDAPAALREMARVLAPGGSICVVGPDMDRVLEGDDDAWGWPGGKPMLINAVEGRPAPGEVVAPGVAHEWIATEENTLALVRSVFPSAYAVPIGSLQGWPSHDYAEWQCAVVV
jgi:SAM-dependent methyltransferase